jgi:hypothetical protein
MKARTMIKRALGRSASRSTLSAPVSAPREPQLIKVAGGGWMEVDPREVDAFKSQGIPVQVRDERDVIIDRFRSMIDKGEGGARGLSAATRRDALRGLARLVEINKADAAHLAGVVSLGERAQGRAVQHMITRGRA